MDPYAEFTTLGEGTKEPVLLAKLGSVVPKPAAIVQPTLLQNDLLLGPQVASKMVFRKLSRFAAKMLDTPMPQRDRREFHVMVDRVGGPLVLANDLVVVDDYCGQKDSRKLV